MQSTQSDFLAERMGTKMVKVYAGSNRKEFKVHKKLLCDFSTFFIRAFDGNSQEICGVIKMPGDSLGITAIFIEWLYRSVLPVKYSEEYYKNLFGLYIFAERLDHSLLANMTIDRIQDFTEEFHLEIHPEMLIKVYKNTPDISPLRNFCLRDFAADMYNEESLVLDDENDLDRLYQVLMANRDIYRDYFKLLREHSQNSGQIESPSCRDLYGTCFFHHHEENEKCHLGRNQGMDWEVLRGDDNMPKIRDPSLDEEMDMREDTDGDSEWEVVLEDSEIEAVGVP